MTSITSPRVATCVVVAAFVSAPAAILPSNARADDSTAAAGELTTVTGSGELDAVLPADGDAAATVDAALATALDVDTTGTAPADASEGGPSEPTPVEVPEPASAAPSPGSSAMEPVSGTDTTAEVPDTTPDTASSSPVSASAPVAVQTVPTNVNVSVPDRERRRQRPRHTDERRRFGVDRRVAGFHGTRERDDIDQRGATEPGDTDSACSHFGSGRRRGGRYRHVVLAVGLRFCSGDINGIAGWIQQRICAAELDMDLELRR